MKNLVNPVVDTITVVAGGTIASGAVVVMGAIRGVAEHAAVSGDLLTLRRHGIFRLAKATGAGTDMAVGDLLEWDAGNSRVADLSTGAVLGAVTKAAATADAVVEVELWPYAYVTPAA